MYYFVQHTQQQIREFVPKNFPFGWLRWKHVHVILYKCKTQGNNNQIWYQIKFNSYLYSIKLS